MLIEFDAAKDAINRAKHGFSLGDAALLDWETMVTWQDTRFDYGEERISGLGLIGARVFSVTFVERDAVQRIISLRKANQRESTTYVEKTQNSSVHPHG